MQERLRTFGLPIFPVIVQPCAGVKQSMTMHGVKPIYADKRRVSNRHNGSEGGSTNQTLLNAAARGLL
jgi:hypothetical protein